MKNFLHFHPILNCGLQTLSVWKSLEFAVWERVKTFAVKSCCWGGSLPENTGLFGEEFIDRLNTYSTLFQLYFRGEYTYLCIPRVRFTSILHNILSKPLVAFLPITIVKTMLTGERNTSCQDEDHQPPEKNWVIWESRQRLLSVLKSSALLLVKG